MSAIENFHRKLRDGDPPYSIQPSRYGPELVLRSPWSDEIERVVVEAGVTGLWLSTAWGWPGGDVGFLRRLPWLHSLQILDYNLEDASPIDALPELRALNLTYVRSRIDFRRFPRLEEIGLEWRAGADGLFALPNMRRLYLRGLPGKKAPLLANLTRLESLHLSGSGATDLDGLRPTAGLRELRIDRFPKLRSNAFLEDLPELEELRVGGCRGFGDLSPLRGCPKLKILVLETSDPIGTLAPVAQLSKLERFALEGESRVVDGKTSILKSIPTLRSASFPNRRHYDAKSEEMPHERWPIDEAAMPRILQEMHAGLRAIADVSVERP